MKHYKWILIVFVMSTLLVASGCGSLDSAPTQDLEELAEIHAVQTQIAQNIIETIVAGTITAMPSPEQQATGESVTVEETPTSQPTQTATATVLPTEAPTLAPTLTPALTSPLAEVSVPTNCRTGPGKIYDKVSVLAVGKQVEIVARNAESTYWIVNNPGGSGTCWLWDQYAKITGSTADLPVWSAPSLPTPAASLTPSLSAVTLKVSVPTNCRVGPGLAYDKVSVLHTGKTVKVIARYAAADFWVIENPEGAGTCWVWGKYATITGKSGDLPAWDAPPKPTTASVTLKVSVDTNCRIGPGIPYDIVTIFRIGKVADVIGRNSAGSFWVIKNPAGSGHCWVWGKYASLTGPYGSLPLWDPPATPTPKP